MEKPVLDFLVYLMRQCIFQYDIDPDITTVADFIKTIEDAGSPIG